MGEMPQMIRNFFPGNDSIRQAGGASFRPEGGILRSLFKRWSARTGVIAFAIVLTLALGLTIAGATFQDGSRDTTTTTSDAASPSAGSSPSSSPDGNEA